MIHDVLILGAGLAGLKAARDLQAAGRSVLVLDKGRGVGGRAATRRWDGVPVDHGAQFFTARSDEFRAQTADWQARGVCFEWARGFHQWDDDGRGLRAPDPAEDTHPRHACRAGMSALGKDLAAGLAEGTVRLGGRVASVQWLGDKWWVDVEGWPEGSELPVGRHLLLALPVPQALALIERPGNRKALDDRTRQALETVEVTPTLALLLRGESPAPGWQGIQLRDETLSWIGADSDKRGGDPAEKVFVLHASTDFSRRWQDADLEEAARRMVSRAGEIVGDWITRLPARQMHRWRFANVPHGLDEQAFLRAEGGLYFAGDAFLGAKIEGAYRSGQEAARAMLAEG